MLNLSLQASNTQSDGTLSTWPSTEEPNHASSEVSMGEATLRAPWRLDHVPENAHLDPDPVDNDVADNVVQRLAADLFADDDDVMGGPDTQLPVEAPTDTAEPRSPTLSHLETDKGDHVMTYLDDEEEEDVDASPSKRLSEGALRTIRAALEPVDDLLCSIADELGYSVDQVRKVFVAQRGQRVHEGINHWNVYSQFYLPAHALEEVSRIRPGVSAGKL